MRSGVANLVYWPWATNLLLKLPFSCCLHTGKYHYLFEGRKVFEYQTETDLLNRPGTYLKGCERLRIKCYNDSELLYWKLKRLWYWLVLIFLKHNGTCWWAVSSFQLKQIGSTSGQKQLTIFTIHGTRRKYYMIKSSLRLVSTFTWKYF